MARYIDADKVMEEIERIGGHNLCEWETIGVKALIDRQPTADVAPKSEVAREIFEEIEKLLKNQEAVTENQRLKEVADWIFHDYLPRKVVELKKKYTEVENGTK